MSSKLVSCTMGRQARVYMCFHLYNCVCVRVCVHASEDILTLWGSDNPGPGNSVRCQGYKTTRQNGKYQGGKHIPKSIHHSESRQNKSSRALELREACKRLAKARSLFYTWNLSHGATSKRLPRCFLWVYFCLTTVQQGFDDDCGWVTILTLVERSLLGL